MKQQQELPIQGQSPILTVVLCHCYDLLRNQISIFTLKMYDVIPTGVTWIKTTALLNPPLPSEIVYENVQSPVKSCKRKLILKSIEAKKRKKEKIKRKEKKKEKEKKSEKSEKSEVIPPKVKIRH